MAATARVDALRDEALAEFRLGDAASAVSKLRRIVADGAASLSDRLLLADVLWADFRFAEAIVVYHEAMAVEPNGIEAPLLAAKRLFSLGRFDQAGVLVEVAAARRPGNPDIVRMLAELRDRQDRLAEAEALASGMLAEYPADARLARSLAHTWRRSGRVDGAARLLERQLADHPGPDDWRLKYELAQCRDRQGDYAGAMQALLDAKHQLRPRAQTHLARWHRFAKRRTELARRLDRSTLIRWAQAAKNSGSATPLAILAGHPRSGTTLIERILASHPGVVTTDETGVLREQFARPIVLDAATTAIAWSELDSLDATQLGIARDFYFRATGAHVGHALDDRLLIEKDPLLTQDLAVPLRLLPEARILMPLRDPRDVCLSFFFTLVPLNAESAPAIDLRTCAASVALSLELWRYWRGILPQPWHELRYESLVRDPAGEAGQACRFLGLRWSAEVLDFHRRPPDGRGVRTPTYGDVRQPLYTRAVGRWKNYAPWLEPALDPLKPVLDEFRCE